MCTVIDMHGLQAELRISGLAEVGANEGTRKTRQVGPLR